ncbi:hypothetical protein PVAP13_7NG057700 [Panicum virgatum]|uniref:Uncharacterized protein n=1 Tax=Panicum virgatum TaxID=38727 RepID=A0A8T0PYS4_PANVG|nr:hypothetical protein PVAP13_7NG057700 [Panicum virgatum]
MQSSFLQYSHQPKNCGFTRWVDPPAIDPYQTYIAYLEDFIDKLKQELAKALVLADRLSSEDDGEPKSASPSSMVFKTNTGCVDEWCCPCHEEKKTPPATPHAFQALWWFYVLRTVLVLVD